MTNNPITQPRIIVAGSRAITDRSWIYRCLDEELCLLEKEKAIPVIVSGMARGPDLIGRDWAISRGLEVQEFPANWTEFGKRAGSLRNREMANYATHLIAFWDGESSGTKNMIELAKTKGLPVRVLNQKDGKNEQQVH